MLTGGAMPANDRGHGEVDDDHKVAVEDSVVLGNQVVLLAVGVVGLQRCGRLEVGQKPRLPLGSGTVQHVTHPLAHPAGRRSQTHGVSMGRTILSRWRTGSTPDPRPFEHLFGG